MKENNNPEKTAFERSLDELSCNDLAPARPRKKKAGRIVEQILWGLLALLLFGVFLYTGSLAVSETIDYFVAESNFDNIAGAFSPISGQSEIPLLLRIGTAMYPIADYEGMKNGNVVYPDDPSDVTLPSMNPGTDDNSDAPKEEDPYLSAQTLDGFRAKLEGLQSAYKNQDIFAWIYIPGTNIEYPVVRSSAQRPDYYLTRGVDKKENTAGSIYMDNRNDPNLLNNNFTVFYGHNIRTKGTMFNRLLEFKNQKMFDKYRYVYVYTKEAALKYEIFSIYEAHSSESPSINIQGLYGDAFLEKITAIQQRSLHTRQGLTLNENDHVLMLYTCANTLSVLTGNDIRCMVFGVLVDATT